MALAVELRAYQVSDDWRYSAQLHMAKDIS
jgi:hypothetical protein